MLSILFGLLLLGLLAFLLWKVGTITFIDIGSIFVGTRFEIVELLLWKAPTAEQTPGTRIGDHTHFLIDFLSSVWSLWEKE